MRCLSGAELMPRAWRANVNLSYKRKLEINRESPCFLAKSFVY